MSPSTSDLPDEIIDIIFSFIPSNGLHVSKKYNDVPLYDSTADHYLLHEHRNITGFCAHAWYYDLGPNHASYFWNKHHQTKNHIRAILAIHKYTYPEIGSIFANDPKKYDGSIIEIAEHISCGHDNETLSDFFSYDLIHRLANHFYHSSNHYERTFAIKIITGDDDDEILARYKKCRKHNLIKKILSDPITSDPLHKIIRDLFS